MPGEELAQPRTAVHVIVVPGTPPTYRFDPSRDESRAARLVVDNVLKRAAGRPDPWSAREDAVQIAGSRYVDWLIPGILCLGIMNNGMWSIGFMTVQARLRRLLKRLAASPMRKRDYLLAQILARLALSRRKWPCRSSSACSRSACRSTAASPTSPSSLVGALMFGAFGLLVGSRVRTIEGINGLMNLSTLPMWVLSGVFFSASNFPSFVQPVIKVLPLTAFVDAMRGVGSEDNRWGRFVPSC